MPGSMNAYGNAGMGFANEAGQASLGMRNLRADMMDRMRELQQRGMKKGMAQDKRDARYGMIEAGLQGAALMPWGKWLKPGQKPATNYHSSAPGMMGSRGFSSMPMPFYDPLTG